MVYDLASSEVVPVGTSFGMRVLQRYPFFVRAQSTAKSVVNADLSNVLVPWPSGIDTTKSSAWSITPLLVTSRGSGALTGETMIEPTREFPRTNLSPQLVAVQVAPKPAGDSTAHGRLVVVGSADVVGGGFAEHSPANASFVMNAIDWLAQDEALITFRSRDTQPPTLSFSSSATREGVKYANLVGVPALTALLGLLHLARRRSRTRASYQRTSPQPSEVPA